MITVKKLKQLKKVISVSIISTSVCFAADIPDNHCAVVVASRQTMEEVHEYVVEHGFVKDDITIYPASNGWFAISVAVLSEEKSTPTLSEWKSTGKIPEDSFCTKGSKFKNGIPLVNNDNPQKLFKKGRCAVIVASRQSVDEAKSFIIDNKLNRDTTKVYPTKSGWFAIGIDVIDETLKKEHIAKLKQQGKVPDDSYCSTGKNYRPALTTVFDTKTTKEKHLPPSTELTKKVTQPEHTKTSANSDKPSQQKSQPQSKYDFQGHFSDGLAVIKKGNKWGFINKQEKEIIPPQYDSTRPFNVGVAIVEKGNKFALINKKGVLITDFNFTNISGFHDGVTIARQNDNVGVVNLSGDVVIPFEYQSISEFKQGIAFAIKNGKKVIVKTDGSINDDYDFIGSFRHGLAPVSISERWGYINHSGEIMIEPQFEFAGPFSKNRARVKTLGKYKFINKKGNFEEVIVPE
ncbi:MAG: WG repeat-containing protein [Gammaproteobacteria bacterium]|nr:WG repeat-containing protein [Gammaproteobacteria bacterium]